ncbi:MAG: molybdenum cofactor guanylyltransferase [Planctomycetales bacterium]|nr:molybdenum cofactor guanylyltransferase [Planctomycetales bacterium]
MNRGAIILCGGKSTRMGASKAWLRWGDETMLARIVRILAPLGERVVVVAAEGQTLPELPAEIIVARDRNPDRGPLEGLAAGLRALPTDCDTVYVSGCDTPLLRADFVERLFSQLAENATDEQDAVAPCDGDFVYPLAGVYRARILPRVELLLSEDRLRLTDLLEVVGAHRVDVETLRDVDPQLDSLRNLNRREEYELLLRRGQS